MINFILMKLLVSPIDAGEARTAWIGGADIIDIKNPREGPLGANYPWVIRETMELLPDHIEMSATIGDLDHRPGLASQAAYGLARLGVDFIKVGLRISKPDRAIEVARAVVKAAEDTVTKVVLAGYADHKKIGTITPMELLEAACKTGAQGVLLDTYHKNGSSLFDHMTTAELKSFKEMGAKQGLTVALAGSIKTEHIPILKEISPHIIGVRGAVCTGNNRNTGRIEREKVKEFKEIIEN